MWGDLNHIIVDDSDESDNDDGNDVSDDGFGSAESEPEDIIVDKTEPEPQGKTKPYLCEPSLPPSPYLNPSMMRRSHPYARDMFKITSMGFDDGGISRIR